MKKNLVWNSKVFRILVSILAFVGTVSIGFWLMVWCLSWYPFG